MAGGPDGPAAIQEDEDRRVVLRETLPGLLFALVTLTVGIAGLIYLALAL